MPSITNVITVRRIKLREEDFFSVGTGLVLVTCLEEGFVDFFTIKKEKEKGRGKKKKEKEKKRFEKKKKVKITHSQKK